MHHTDRTVSDLSHRNLTGVAGLVGLAHGALFSSGGTWLVEASFSVDEGWRGLGLGKWLMAAVQDFGRQAGTSEVVGMCLACNLRMRRVFECAGMTLTREDGALHARGRLSQSLSNLGSTGCNLAAAGLIRSAQVGRPPPRPVDLAV